MPALTADNLGFSMDISHCSRQVLSVKRELCHHISSQARIVVRDYPLLAPLRDGDLLDLDRLDGDQWEATRSSALRLSKTCSS